jgi:hypothetical protein
LLLVPQRADHDRAVDVAVLEHDEELVVDFGEKVRPAIRAAHRHRDPRPVRLLGVAEPRILDLDVIAGIAVAILVVDDDREVNAAQLGGTHRQRHHAVDREERHGQLIFLFGAS